MGTTISLEKIVTRKQYEELVVNYRLWIDSEIDEGGTLRPSIPHSYPLTDEAYAPLKTLSDKACDGVIFEDDWDGIGLNPKEWSCIYSFYNTDNDLVLIMHNSVTGESKSILNKDVLQKEVKTKIIYAGSVTRRTVRLVDDWMERLGIEWTPYFAANKEHLEELRSLVLPDMMPWFTKYIYGRFVEGETFVALY